MNLSSPSKRVVLLATAVGPRNRGIGQYERAVLPPLLARLLDRGARPAVIISADGEIPFDDPRVRFVRLPVERDRTLIRSAVEQFCVPWTALGADRFVSLESVFPFPPVPARKRLVVVHDIHVLRHRRDPGRFPEDYSRRYTLWAPLAMSRALRTADKVIADSEFTRREILEAARIAPERVVSVPAGLDHARFRPAAGPEETRRVRAKYGLPESFYLYVGPRSRKKNLRLILEAYKTAGVPAGVRLPVAVAGDMRGDRLYGSLMADLQDPRLADRFILLGNVPDEDLPALYAASRAFLYPSLYEGFGLPVLEAMACGTPVVAADASSLPEVAGDAALLVDPHDPRSLLGALERVGVESERARLIGLGLARARRYSWDRTADRLSEEILG